MSRDLGRQNGVTRSLRIVQMIEHPAPHGPSAIGEKLLAGAAANTYINRVELDF